MKKIIYPKRKEWSKLMERPTIAISDLNKTVLQIFDDIRINGDKAVGKYTYTFDKVKLKNEEFHFFPQDFHCSYI